jgi:origin recognition complex subunit 1
MPHDRFVCGFAIDNAKCLYYDFRWSAHHARALAASILTPQKAEIAEDGWERGDVWDVAISVVQKNRKKVPLGTVVSESEGSDDEYVHVESGDEEEVPPSASEEEDGGDVENMEEDEEENADPTPRTPRKRKRGGMATTPRSSRTTSPRKRTAAQTPRRPRTQTLAQPTPHSKARARGRPRKAASTAVPQTPSKRAVVRPPPPQLTQEHYRALARLPQDAWLRAMHVLHVAARPDLLPCREEEYGRVLRSVEELVEEGSGGCVCEMRLPY